MEHYSQHKKQGLYDPAFEHDSCGVGFIAHLHGKKSHHIVQSGLEILENLTHRGATGSDPKTGDGAGILIQIPDQFLRKQCEKIDIALPQQGDYAVGNIFLPPSLGHRNTAQKWIERTIREEGQVFLGWRDIPHDSEKIG
ncbi:MAG TPA: hypothetical protein PKH98_06330, partial [Candidatus Omnitrophota bacterium]|nr:hypothetical protein [Candidatus Omnitrophota bacterium]